MLVAAHLSDPAATTVYGLTSRRLWALLVLVLALVGVLVGGLALVRPAVPVRPQRRDYSPRSV